MSRTVMVRFIRVLRGPNQEISYARAQKRTFRVFISSTFEDLKAERDALQKEVFPKLRKLCERQGATFQAIDLR